MTYASGDRRLPGVEGKRGEGIWEEWVPNRDTRHIGGRRTVACVEKESAFGNDSPDGIQARQVPCRRDQCARS